MPEVRKHFHLHLHTGFCKTICCKNMTEVKGLDLLKLTVEDDKTHTLQS